ncbi:MAG: pitrilysin family protein [Elusimicrobia bacterium]|nr:pitrilysin family protein [Elusimicrobiota bacterium]
MKNRLFSVMLAAALLPAYTFSMAALPPGVTKGASVEGIDEYMLPNGLKVLLFPDHTKPTVTVNITYEVGSRNENYGETGMAHLLEHLMFKGTPKHPNIPQELTAHGTSPNASTSYDRTNYFETFSATDANLDWALSLEADRMVNSNIAKKDLDSEMTVVRNEFESGENNPRSILMERVMSEAYLWHNYGKAIIGARSDIENVPIDRLQAFYHNWYQPDNAVLTVAGDFDPAKTLAQIQKKFGAIPRPKRAMRKTYTQDPTQDGERQVILRRVGDTQEVMAAYHVPASSEKDSAALDVLAFVLGDTPAGRLYKALVDTKKAAMAFGFNYDLREGGLMLFGASVRKEGSLEDVRDELLKLVEGASSRDYTQEEVDRAKTAILKDIDLTLKSPDRVGMRLSESIASGDWRLFFIRRDQVKAVTLDDVKRAADHYLKNSNRTLGLFYPTEKPDRAEIPAAPDVAALVKDYKGGKAVEAGEAFDPSTENIDKRTLHDSLKDGLKLAMLPKKTRGSSIRLMLTLKMGSEESLKNMAEVQDLTGSMLMRGTLHHTRQQIQDEFDRLKTRASIGGGYVSLETDKENLAAALKLAAEVLKEPAFPESEFATLKQEELAGIEEQKSDPEALAIQEFYRHLSPYPKEDVRYTPTFDEQIAGIKAVTLDQVKAFHKDFYGASAGQLAVVGDFDPKEFKALAEELFGGWISPKPFSRLVSAYKDIAPEDVAIETPDKANANAYLGVNFAMRDDNPDYPALTLANFMTGGGFLNSRLAVRIRQKEGLSYGVGSYVSVNSLDEYARFLAYAIFNPKNADKLKTAFREELARVAKDGFTDKEIVEAKDGWLQSRKVGRANDARLASQLASNEYLGRTMAWDGELEKKVAALTQEQIRAAFAKWIPLDKMSFVLAGDFAKAKAEAASGAQAAAAEKK